MKKFFLTISLLIPVIILSGQVNFNPKVDYPMEADEGVFLADIDNDGELDALTINKGGNQSGNSGISVRLGDAVGQFGPTTNYFPLKQIFGLSVSDLNNDTYPDLIAHAWNEMYVLFNDPNNLGTFIVGLNGLPSTYSVVGGFKGRFESDDLNNDGFNDVVITAGQAQEIHVYLNNPLNPGVLLHNSNTDVYTGLSAISYWESKLADVDNDNIIDIICAAGGGTDNVFYFPGNGNGTFQARVDLATNGADTPRGIEVADFNGDNVPDIAIAAQHSQEIKINLDVTGAQTNWLSFTTSGEVSGLVSEDMDNDGDIDLIVTVFNGFGRGVKVFYNNGNGIFNNYSRFNVTNQTLELEIGDLNNDGFPDVVTSNRYSSSMSVLLSDTTNVDTLAIKGNVNCTNDICIPLGNAPNQQVCIFGPNSTNFVFTNANGEYCFNNAISGNSYSVTLCPFPGACATPVVLPNLIRDTSDIDFGVVDTCNVAINMTGSHLSGGELCEATNHFPTTPCNGITWQYCIEIRNESCFATNLLNLKFEIPQGGTVVGTPTTLNPCGIGGTPITIGSPNTNGGIITWPGSNTVLDPNQCYEVCIDVLFSSLTSGSVNNFASIRYKCNEGGAQVNTDYLMYNDTCSCDPNFKTVYPAGCGPNNAVAFQPLDYHVHFGNEGVGDAFTVRVEDYLDFDLDLSTFQITNSSHTITSASLNNSGFLVVEFNGIELGPGEQGWFEYTILPKPVVYNGGFFSPSFRIVTNKASIFFDNSSSVETNTTSNWVIPEDLSAVTNEECQAIYIGYSSSACVDLITSPSGGLPLFGYTYQWSTGGTTSTITVCPTVSTDYSVTITDYSGCEIVKSFNVYVEDVTCGRNKVIICHKGNEICVSRNSVASHLAHGDFMGSCEPDNCANSLRSVLPSKEFSLRTYPNPAINEIIVHLETSDLGQARLELIDIAGRIMFVRVVDLNDYHQQLSLDINHLPKGMYVLKTELNGKVQTQKVIKQ